MPSTGDDNLDAARIALSTLVIQGSSKPNPYPTLRPALFNLDYNRVILTMYPVRESATRTHYFRITYDRIDPFDEPSAP